MNTDTDCISPASTMVVKMIAELNAASDLMETAVQRYLDACLMIEDSFLKGNHDPKLVDRADNELMSFAAFESKMKSAKLAVQWVRNRSPSISPINILLSEVLGYIFTLALQIRILWIHISSKFDRPGAKINGGQYQLHRKQDPYPTTI
ncbi:hypothetical protein CTheo_7053 [Ceratobasidium theobromae]|uniref:Uncharacterized protein n=1 Tax=Ceratobasidium theobromae TaxID=1582974 RepID=A0A5N5QCN2_9AGAM|nr:hypothetical protein CTheo_7053 [Ceratobasidium theobromae]